MAGRVIQGCFLGGQPRAPASTAWPAALTRPLHPPPSPFAAKQNAMQPKAAGRQPGPPVPAFAGRPPVAQASGANDSFQVDPARLGLASGAGRPLPDAVRAKMEAALGADFSGVRVHVGPQADRIGAIAFTMGQDIYFAPGRFQPATAQGQQLLGHELAHVVQQRQGRVRNPAGSGVAVVQDRALEAEADRLGQRAATASMVPQANIQRTATTPPPGHQPSHAIDRRAIQPAGGNAQVIQRIGQEAFGYEITATSQLQNLTKSGWQDELKKDRPLQGLVPVTSAPVTFERWQALTKLTSILVNSIKTLRLRESMWKGAKERQLSRTLTTLDDAQKVRKIKDAFRGYEEPVPATNDLAELKALPEVIELFDINPRLKAEVEWTEPADRHATIMAHALTVDAPVSAATLPSRRFDFETLRADPTLKMLMAQNDLSWAKDGSRDQIKSSDGIVLLTFYHRDEAFVQQVAADPTAGIHRPVFYKRGKAAGPGNEYVKDDKGVFTRRWAYVEKNKYQFRDLANQGYLAGRYPTQQTELTNTPIAYNALDAFAKKQVPALRGAASLSAYQLAYLHQELGSGHQQRGVSATSSPKHHIFSNAGKSFRTDDGVRIQVDLARVRQGSDAAPELINHYAAEARDKKGRVIGGYTVKGRPFEHYEWSVKKNRELFIKEVRPEHITALSLHQTASGASHQEIKPGGFRQSDVVTLGENVGLAAYNAGFVAGSGGLPSSPDAFAPDKQKYYLEGHADGTEYRAGYAMGVTRRPRVLRKAGEGITDLKDDTKVRYTQGFWDGYHRRVRRRN